MKTSQKIIAAVLLQVSAVVLTFTTGVLGAVAFSLQLRFLSLSQFLGLQLLTVLVFIQTQYHFLTIGTLTVALAAFLFHLFSNKSLFVRGIAATFIPSFLLLFLGAFTIQFVLSKELVPFLIQNMEYFLSRAQRSSGASLNPEIIIYQIPSYVVCLVALNVWVVALFKSKENPEMVQEIRTFTAPPAWIWTFILSLPFVFIEVNVKGLQEVAVNVLNISLLLYFFQGLAVLSFIINAMRFSTLIKLLIYFIFIFQILLPICLGIIDFWLDLRTKVQNKLNENKSEFGDS